MSARHARLVDGIDPVDLETTLRTLARIHRQIASLADPKGADPGRFRITRLALWPLDPGFACGAPE